MIDPAALTTRRVRIWDLPTRLFHWLLVLGVVGLFITGKIGGNAITWHLRLGVAVGALLVFRIVWGFIGGRWSRFAQFVRGPGTVWRYLSGRSLPGEVVPAGHNPLGALSVLAMLVVLAVQVGTGLLADDEIATVGPLNRFVATDTGLAATAWHKGYGQTLILALVGLHLAAILFYTWRGQRLVGAMISGDQRLADEVPAARDDAATGLRAVVLALLCAAAAIAVLRLGG